MSWQKKLAAADEAVRFGDLDLGFSLLSEALQEAKKYGSDSVGLAKVHEHLAMLEMLQKKPNQALINLQMTLKIKEANYPSNHIEIAKTLTKLCDIYGNMGDLKNTEPLLERLYLVHKSLYGEGHVETATTAHHLALLYHAVGKRDKAELLYKIALYTKTRCFGAENQQVAMILSDYATLLNELHRGEEADHLMACATS